MRNTTNTVLQLRWSLLRPRSHYRERRAAGSVLYQSVKKSCFKRICPSAMVALTLDHKGVFLDAMTSPVGQTVSQSVTAIFKLS